MYNHYTSQGSGNMSFACTIDWELKIIRVENTSSLSFACTVDQEIKKKIHILNFCVEVFRHLMVLQHSVCMYLNFLHI